jgi:hypothetical protein
VPGRSSIQGAKGAADGGRWASVIPELARDMLLCKQNEAAVIT